MTTTAVAMTMTTTAAGATTPANRDSPSGAAVCGGDGCETRSPWPLYNVRHRSVYCRLCTSCVLRHHPGSFCCSCFDLIDPPGNSPPGRSLTRCAKCPAAAHLDCLREPDVAASHYLCPACSSSNPRGFSYSPAQNPGHAIDLHSAKMLIAAARLSATSMARGAASARADAERKAREAALARKRAKEMLERAISIAKKEKEAAAAVASTATPTSKMTEPKKKIQRTGSADVSVDKKFQDRQREKLMRFQEPIKATVHRPLAHAIAEKESNKVPPVNGVHNYVNADAKVQGVTLSRPSNIVKKEERKKATRGLSLGSQDVVITKGKEKGMAIQVDKGLRIPQPTQGVPISMINNKDIAKVPPNTSSFHS